MKKSLIRKCCLYAPVLILSLIMISCSSTQKVKYFQDIPDSGQLKTIPAAAYIEPKVQVDDILSVTVQTVDPAATQIINSGNAAGSPSTSGSLSSAAGSLPSTQQPLSGYLVDKEGNINVPVLGTIKVVGYSISELTSKIHDIASRYYNNPTVTVRYTNFKISVMGEVLKPGVYVMPNEKVSILDALAMAGDLTIFGKRENVLLVRRNQDGTQTPYRINLKKSDIMSSPYYYLQQNDLIYVEPRKAKSDATDAAQTRYLTLAGTILSLLIILAYKIK